MQTATADIIAWPDGPKAAFYARPYGRLPADLDIDPGTDDTATAVTRLLRACLLDDQGVSPASDTLWSWNLGRRLQGLLAIVHTTHGKTLDINTRCPECGEWMELPLPLADLGAHFPRDEQVTVEVEPGTQVELRLPAGHDQQRWALEDVTDAQRFADDIIVAINGKTRRTRRPLPDAWLERIGESLARHDPLTVFTLTTRCPACARDVSLAIDLEQQLLGVLGMRRRRLLNDVHRIATQYHWHEADILAMSESRRGQYLRRIADGAGL